MRAVFSAMRRSFASIAILSASSRRGARSTSRSVSRTGILASRSLRHRDHGYIGAALGFGLELDSSVGQCEQRVILAYAHVLPGMPFGAALARKDIAGEHRLAAEQFHAEASARRVATVARGTACFLVSHGFAAFVSSVF